MGAILVEGSGKTKLTNEHVLRFAQSSLMLTSPELELGARLDEDAKQFLFLLLNSTKMMRIPRYRQHDEGQREHD